MGVEPSDRRQGRKCGSCLYMNTSVGAYHRHYLCSIALPPHLTEWGVSYDKKKVDPEKTWCDFWVVDPSQI